MQIIDSHAHFFPDEVAAAAIPAIEASSGCKAHTDGTRAAILASMDRAGIECSVVLPVATNPEKVSSINRYSASIERGRLYMLGALHPLSLNWASKLEELLEQGFTGVKFHPEFQQFVPDDTDLLPLFAALRDSGLVLFFHAGEDPSYRPPCNGRPATLARLLEKLPGIKMVAAHMGGFRVWEEAEECLFGKEVWLDTSFSFDDLSDERMRGLIHRHGADKVLFGTDSPWRDQAAEVENILRLGLGTETEEKIFSGNAIRLLPELGV